MTIPLRMVHANATAAGEQPCASPICASVGSRSNVLFAPWGAWGTRRGRCVNRARPTARVVTQSGNGVEQLHPVPECCDAKLLQVLFRQARKNRLVYLIVAECRLVLTEAQAPQPDRNVHDGAHNRG